MLAILLHSRILFHCQVNSLGGSTFDIVSGGAKRGANLFHSFQLFNVAQGRGVFFFLSDSATRNVFARITGSQPSEIAGILGTRVERNGAILPTSANLFLMNPNGILFRNNAVIDVSGSFVTTSADAIQFQQQGQFSAIQPERSTLLTVEPSAFLFQQSNPQPIAIQPGSTLAKIGQTLVLLGGSLSFNNSKLNVQNTALELGGLAQPGIVPFSIKNEVIRLNLLSTGNLADITLANRSLITAIEDLPSSIRLFGNQILLGGGSTIATINEGIQSSSGIEIQASQLNLAQASQIATQTTSTGKAGDILIKANTLFLDNFSGIISGSVLVPGNTGNLTLQISNLIRLTGQSIIGTQILGQALVSGQEGGGEVLIETKDLDIQNAQITSNSLLGEGNAGSLTLRIGNTIKLDRAILSTASLGFGKAGNLNLEARELLLNNGSQIVTTAFSPTQFDVNALLQTVLSQFPSDTSLDFQQALFGLITNYLKVTSADEVRLGQTGSGNITIRASDQVQLRGISVDRQLPSQIFMDTSGAGNAGALNLTTGKLHLSEGATISAQTSGAGRGGDLAFQTGSVELIQGAQISTRSLDTATGAAGNIRFRIDRQLSATDSNISTTSARSSGGTIEINAGSIQLNGNSNITTAVFRGVGNGGNITLDARSIIALGDSDLLAFAQDGQGGNITLNTRAFFGQNYRPLSLTEFDNNNQVDLNASGRISGTIQRPDTTFIQNSLNQLSQTSIDTNTILTNSCITRDQVTGSFYLKGTGGLPIRPGDLPISPYPVGSIQSTQPSWRESDRIQEPQAAYQLSDGRIILSRACSESGAGTQSY